MPESRHDLSQVNLLQAEAFGVPGQRTFRILAANTSTSAALWLEKEQLAQLGIAIESHLERLEGANPGRGQTAPDPVLAYGGKPEIEFRVAQLALGFDERQNAFLLLGYQAEDVEPDLATVSCQATAGQFRALAEEIARVVVSGRPICPLCRLPMDPDGHACAKTNGHLKQPIPPLETDDDDE